MPIFKKFFNKAAILLAVGALGGMASRDGATASSGNSGERTLEDMRLEGKNLLKREGYKDISLAGETTYEGKTSLLYDVQGKGQTMGVVGCEKGKACKLDYTAPY